jgi:hypothetical protein
VRVYLPATLPLLRTHVAAGEVGPAPVTAFAVTPALREWYADADIEELEYAAMSDAALGSLRLLSLAGDVRFQRVVLAADVPEAAARPEPQLDRAVVRLATPVPWTAVVSVLADDSEAQADVRAAAAAVLAADLGDADAQFTVDQAGSHELAWWAASEVGQLLA